MKQDGWELIPLRHGPDVFDAFLAVLAAYRVNQSCEGDWKRPGSGWAGLPVDLDELDGLTGGSVR